jgi:hypothetical protein
VDETHEVAAADHAERGVAGVDQLPGGFHDVAQHRVEVLGAGHGEVGVQQPPQPALGVLHVAGPRHQLFEQLVELQPGHLGMPVAVPDPLCSAYGRLGARRGDRFAGAHSGYG